MLKTGEWLAIAVFGLITLFVFISISFFNFLIGPNSAGPQTTIEPSSSFLQVIFISLAPGIALSLFTNKISDESKFSHFLIIGAGFILVIGMIYDNAILIPQIHDVELPLWINYSLWIFLGLGILVIFIGYLSYRKNKLFFQKQKFEN